MVLRKDIMGKRRKGFMAVLLPWLNNFGKTIALIAIVAAAGAWVIASGSAQGAINWAAEQTLQATVRAGFEVKNLYVEGRVHADPASLREIIGLEVGDPLLRYSPNQIKERLEQTEWVNKAQVSRLMPDTLYISLQERVPTALWYKENKLVLVGEDGSPITADRIDRFAELIILIGSDAPEGMTELLQNLRAEPLLEERVKAAQRLGGRRWDLTLDNGVILRLPEDKDMGYALKRAAKAQSEDDLFDKAEIESVDLRYEDKMVLKTRAGEANTVRDQENKAGGAV